MIFYDFILSAIKQKLGIENLVLEIPKDKSFGDFATNVAMQLAKSERKNPKDVAAAMITKIREIDFIDSVDVANPGFININIKNDFIIKFINSTTPALCATPSPAKGISLVIDMDYGSYNVAKALHIGHFRGSIVGDTFYRVARFLGHRPISYNHMGDWGKPMALVIAWIMKEFPNEWNRPDFEINAAEFNGYYPAAAKYAKENPEFEELVLGIKKEFQDGRADYFALYEKFLKISLAEMDGVVRRLNIVPFDNNLGERNAAKYLTPVEEILGGKNLLRSSGGATIIDLKTESDAAPMPPFMFYDSRGADTYDSTDLAAVYYRKITDAPDKIIYISDFRQNLHFEQLFRASEMAGIMPQSALEALGYGSINGADGKPLKTRDGTAATLGDIIDMAEDAVRARVSDGGKSLPEETIKMIALAALKFNDLMHDLKSSYVFDPAAVTNFEGRTGPYILYTAVRINSALKKSQFANRDSRIEDISDEYGRGLMLKILEFPRMIQTAFEKRATDILANYAYDLCQMANGFYHNRRIADDMNGCAIARKAAETLALCVDLMGLKIPDEM